MDWLGPTWAIYRQCVSRGARLAVRNWAVLATIPFYAAVLWATLYGGRFLGLLGGFLNALAWAFCAGSFLFLVETIVRTNRVTWTDFRNSLGAYLGEVLGVMFTLWVFELVLSRLVRPLPNGVFLSLGAELLLLVFFNALPELIYLGRHTLLDLLSASYAFIVENWLEWFPLNLLLFFFYGLLRAQNGRYLFAEPTVMDLSVHLLETAAAALFVYFIMIVRGFLFLELYGSTRRSRSFRYRAGS